MLISSALRLANASLVLLQAELTDGRHGVVQGLLDDGGKLLRRRGHRDRTGILDQRPVAWRRHDLGDILFRLLENRLRRAAAGANAEPAETNEVKSLLLERRHLGHGAQALG